LTHAERSLCEFFNELDERLPIIPLEMDPWILFKLDEFKTRVNHVMGQYNNECPNGVTE
jgi:hypothetical protein